MRVTLVNSRGSEVVLTDEADRWVRLIEGGVDGLLDYTGDTWLQESGSGVGSLYLGSGLKARTVYLDVWFMAYQSSSAAGSWKRLAQFLGDGRCVIRVEHNEVRSTGAIFEGVLFKGRYDPSKEKQRVAARLAFKLPKPVWTTGWVTIARDRLSIQNVGDFSLHPQVVVSGANHWVIHAGDKTYAMPRDIAQNAQVLVDFDPASRQVVSNEDNLVWARMNGVRLFAPVMPGESKEFRVHYTGGNPQVRFRYVYSYRNPF